MPILSNVCNIGKNWKEYGGKICFCSHLFPVVVAIANPFLSFGVVFVLMPIFVNRLQKSWICLFFLYLWQPLFVFCLKEFSPQLIRYDY